jgi:hypothetical protein
MTDAERSMQEMLSEGSKFNPVRAEQMSQEIIEKYNKKLLVWKIIIWVMLAFDFACMAGLAVLFVLSESMKVQIACAAGFLFFYVSSLLEKGWYWYLSLRYRVQRDLLELKLQIAELANNKSGHGQS